MPETSKECKAYIRKLKQQKVGQSNKQAKKAKRVKKVKKAFEEKQQEEQTQVTVQVTVQERKKLLRCYKWQL